MNRPTFDRHWQEFTRSSQAAQDFRFALSPNHFQPELNDDTTTTGFSFCYVVHTGWAARVLMRTQPQEHVDISSYVYFASIASAIVPKFKFYDIRPAYIPLPGMETGAADLLALPFADNSIESLSCLHVMEHVGLGRYGDRLDATGDLKAAAELKRVLKPGGQLLMVLPMNQNPYVVFNAHRLYSHGQVMDMFAGLTVEEFAVVKHIGAKYISPAQPSDIIRGPHNVDDAGCFVFRKPK